MKKLYIFSFLASLLATSACTSTTELYKDEVAFDSMLPGAEVYVNGELVGQTPCTANLSINSIHEVEFVKNGFKNESHTIIPAPKESYVKFGPLVDTGYYRTLSPSDIYAEMKPDIIPASTGEDAFSSLTESYEKLEALKKTGTLTRAEYNYILDYMTKFYSK